MLFAFVALGQADRGKIACFSVAALGMALRLAWDHRNARFFWPTYSLCVMLHGVFVLIFSAQPERTPGAAMVPFWLLDMFVLVWVLGKVSAY